MLLISILTSLTAIEPLFIFTTRPLASGRRCLIFNKTKTTILYLISYSLVSPNLKGKLQVSLCKCVHPKILIPPSSQRFSLRSPPLWENSYLTVINSFNFLRPPPPPGIANTSSGGGGSLERPCQGKFRQATWPKK